LLATLVLSLLLHEINSTIAVENIRVSLISSLNRM
jgi:hypothetical protein